MGRWEGGGGGAGEVLVATPGRLIDFADRGVVTFRETRFLVRYFYTYPLIYIYIYWGS